MTDQQISPRLFSSPTSIAKVCALLTLLIAILGPVHVAWAQTTCTVPGSYSSIQAAVNDTACDVIDVAAGTFTETLTISRDVSIVGQGSASTIVQAATTQGAATDRVILINSGNTVAIEGMTIRHGKLPEITTFSGGGILNFGTLIMTETDVVLNIHANPVGGGIGGVMNVNGIVTITRSTISNNTGSGIYNLGTTTPNVVSFKIVESTVSGNSVFASGGGIFNDEGAMVIVNSTISNNDARNGQGGGIANDDTFGDLTIVNSTITGNFSSVAGGGIENQHIATIKNSIVVDNNSNQAGTDDCRNHHVATAFNTPGINLFGSETGCPAGLTFNPAMDLDPNLADNGGPTLTHALPVGSQAIDAVTDCTDTPQSNPIMTDQRGVARPQGTNCDIGAVEVVQDDEGPITSNVVANPNPVEVNTSITLGANVDDSTAGGSIVASAEYNIDGGAFSPMVAVDSSFDEVSEDVTASVPAFTEPDVHEICVRGTDDPGNTGAVECIFVAVYDPEGGFVTGGGWIDSPAGACVDFCSGATGKANFGFVSKYKKGANVPTGNTEFNFSAGGLNFHSDAYDWLVVNQGGTNAQYKGSGTINGSGDYKFMLWAKDDSPNDTFRIKIWSEDGSGNETVIYDNGFDQPIGGGNIKIHQ